MQITFHGKFAKDYGADHRIDAASIAEAIDALSRQIGFYADRLIDKRPVMRIVGYDSIEALDECPDRIDVVPDISGGSGSLGKIVLGVALVGLAFVPGVGTIASGMLANALFGIGVSLALTGVSQMFTKAPSLSRESDPDASKYLGLSNNTTKLGTLRSYSMGRVKITAPHLLALNVDSNDLVKGEFPA